MCQIQHVLKLNNQCLDKDEVLFYLNNLYYHSQNDKLKCTIFFIYFSILYSYYIENINVLTKLIVII